MAGIKSVVLLSEGLAARGATKEEKLLGLGCCAGLDGDELSAPSGSASAGAVGSFEALPWGRGV